MRNRKIWIILAILIVLAAAGWFGWKHYKQENENPVSGLKPRVEMGIGHITNITDSTIDLTLDLLVHNPLPVELDIRSMEYFVQMNGVTVIENEYEKPLLIKSRDSTMVRLPSQLKIKKLKKEGETEAKEGEDSANYHFEGRFALNKSFLSKDSITLEKDKRLPLYRLPQVSIVDFDLTKFRLGTSEVLLKLKFSNKNPFPVQFEDPAYVVSLGKQHRLAEGTVKGATRIKGKSSELYDIPLAIDMGELIKAAGQVITKGNSVPFTLYFKTKLLSDNEIFKKSDVNIVVDGELKDIQTVQKNLSK